MLMKCPECELQVSDKAISCPHCGYPLKNGKARQTRGKKRGRLPNGFGQITKINNPRLRNPYRVCITVGKTPEGKVIQKLLKPVSYFPTYNAAYEALVEYHKNPYDIGTASMTVKELYEKWTENYFKICSPAYQRTITSCWAYCSSLCNMQVRDLRARHMKGCIDNGYRIETTGKKKGQKIYPSAGTKSRIKSLFNLMLDYALEYEIVEMNYARTFEVSDDITTEIQEKKKDHIIFTDEEMKILWKHVNDTKFVDMILIQCYSGWRPQELATLRLDEIHFEENYMQAGMKTEAGKQRIVPIHSKIKDLVKRNMDFAESIGSEYLFNDKGQTHAGSWKMTYDKYANRYKKVIKQLELNPDHRPHDPRKTFITMAKKAEMDEYALKEIVGHSIQDITESTYTVRDVDWLRKDLEKIK